MMLDRLGLDISPEWVLLILAGGLAFWFGLCCSKAHAVRISRRGHSSRLKEKYRESELHDQILFAKMFNGLFVAEPIRDEYAQLRDFRFVEFNPALEQQLNLQWQDICGKTWLELRGYPHPELSVFQKVLETGESQKIEGFDPDYNRHYIANVFKIGERFGVIYEDITAYRRAIAKIEQLNLGLEARIRERTVDLQQAVDELESFTYTVAHDLKSPLRSIAGYSKFIMEDYGPELNEDLTQMVSAINMIGNNTIQLIDHLLHYCRTTNQELIREEIDLRGLIMEAFAELQAGAAGQELQLKWESVLPVIRGDRLLIKEVFTNVLANAIKFSRERPKTVITIGCRMLPQECQIYIRDNGVGFDMEFGGKLFGIFERLHTAEEFEGSGIGLATVKKIMQRHGGRVWIEGKVNAGATVYLFFPVGG